MVAAGLWLDWSRIESTDRLLRPGVLRNMLDDQPLEEFKAAVARCPSVDVRDESGWTLLMAAAVMKKPEVVEYLLSQGADPNAQVLGREMTALDLAVTFGNLTTVRQLLAAGAEVDRCSPSARAELVRACQHDCDDIRVFLVKAQIPLRVDEDEATEVTE
jgi:ankyrin repeat protein